MKWYVRVSSVNCDLKTKLYSMGHAYKVANILRPMFPHCVIQVIQEQ